MITERQIKIEHKAFQKKLDFFQQENALLKYTLSDLVDKTEEKGFLQIAEYFQNELLLNDERINHLIKKRQRISEQFSALELNRNLSGSLLAVEDKFRSDLSAFEKTFQLLSKEFNQKMLQNTRP